MIEKFTAGKIAAHIKYDFILKSAGLQYLRPLLFSVPETETSQPDYLSNQLKTPVFDAVKLISPEDENLSIFLDVALIDAHLPKVIKETALLGRDGTIKEYISSGDWQITIRGAVFSENKNTYPYEEINALNNLCKLRTQLIVESKLLNYLEVTNVVLTSLTWKQQSGSLNKMAFEINCLSDTPYELELNPA